MAVVVQHASISPDLINNILNYATLSSFPFLLKRKYTWQ
jgi:hypothetical protein